MKNLLLSFIFTIVSTTIFSQNLLKNIAQSDASSDITEFISPNPFNPIKGDTLFFLATDTSKINGYGSGNLWFTNGTAANTKRVTNINDNNQKGSHTILTNYKGKIYYQVNAFGTNYLYASNGSVNTLVRNFGSNNIQTAYVLGNMLYMLVRSNTGLELWKTDGTTINTTKVTDVAIGSYYYNYFQDVVAGDKLYFSLFTATYGAELWVTDGTAAGTKIVKDIETGTTGSNPTGMRKVGNTVFFFAGNTKKVWKTDGTEAGTSIVANSIDGNTSYYPSQGAGYGSHFYFSANFSTLYKTDGSTVSQVKTNVSLVSEMVVANNLLFFVNKNGNDFELWKSDGQTSGTAKIKTLVNATRGEIRMFPGQTKCYIEYFNYGEGNTGYNGNFQNNLEHIVSDGTLAGTMNIKDLNPNFTVGSYTTPIRVVGDTYYFSAYDAINGFELWKSDGTSGGTSIVKNINTSVGSSSPEQFVAANNAVYFMANDIKYGRELWKTEGTSASTQIYLDYNAYPGIGVNYDSEIFMTSLNNVLIAQIGSRLLKIDGTNPPLIISSGNSSIPPNPEFTKFNNKLYYRWYSSDYGAELWTTDGTTASLVKDLTAGYSDSNPTKLVVSNNLLFFTTNDNTKLWKSDGTNAGTVLVKQFANNIQSKLVDVNGKLFFTVYDATNGTELWVSDGTTAGTMLVKDINAGSSSSNPTNLIAYNGNLLFVAYNGSNYSIWKSDGTASNTSSFFDTYPNMPIVFKNKVYFIAYDNPTNKYLLWESDGTTTKKVKELASSLYLSPNSFVNIEDKYLVFDILPTTTTHELWISDGTTDETKLVKTIRNTAILAPEGIKEYFYNNKKLYFAADDGVNGKELWMWDFTCPDFYTITETINTNATITYGKYIIGKNIIEGNAKVNYQAQNYISLKSGFETKSGTTFTTELVGCQNPPMAAFSPNLPAKPMVFASNVAEVYQPSIQEFLFEPSNSELLSVYQEQMMKNNLRNISIINDSTKDKYLLRLVVDGKEYVGSLLKK